MKTKEPPHFGGWKKEKMKCQGDKYCRKEAEYGVKLYDEEKQDNFWFYVCGYCLVGRYISSTGLKEGVLEVVRL